MMEEDPLIPLVHVWTNAAFDSSSSSSSAWHAHATPVRRGEKENRRPPEPHEDDDVDAEIARIEAEILRLSSRLHHLRVSRGYDAKQRVADAGTRPRVRGLSLAPLDADTDQLLLLPEKQLQQQAPPAAQKPKPAPKPQRLSLGPLDIAAANPTKAPASRQQQAATAAASRILRPIKEPPVQRRRGVSLGPMEIQHGISGIPNKAAAAAAGRAKPFPNKLNAIREEAAPASRQPAVVPAKLWPSSNARQPLDSSKQGTTVASRAKARSSSMSPRARRQSIARATNGVRGGIAAFGATKVVADEFTPIARATNMSNASTCKRPSGSSKVRVVPSRYSLMPGASLGAATQEKRRKESLPGSAASQREETKATPTELADDDLSPESIDKVGELLPRIRTMPPPDETPRDSGCAKRAADLVGKRSFFAAAAAGDGISISSYQARVLEAEAPEEEALGDEAAA